MRHYTDDIEQALIIYKRRLARHNMILAKHKRKTCATMGLWLPVWAFHAFRLHGERVAAKHIIEALEFGLNVQEVVR